ncbi:hypothetical protein CACET_c07460 [Clostridium aceticum]|uniref:Uncharacterized protein n=1 Tax=Clostridium aceticum TaxID=84022 RepID=A0A0G3W6D7_9CLOT|nr:hypothetical protein CACET_c07460 [Clostridium aceticum]
MDSIPDGSQEPCLESKETSIRGEFSTTLSGGTSLE